MKWTRGYRSDDVEIRDRESPRGMNAGMLGTVFSLVSSRFGVVTGLLFVGAIVAFNYFSAGLAPSGAAAGTRPAASSSDPRVQFVSFVLDDAQKTWSHKFPAASPYQRAKLVLFENATSTACGYGESATGPFYCPRDQKVYLDLGFFSTLSQRFGANGDFAQAYVIAHELGHHVQHQLGLIRDEGRLSASESVRVELQADCFAGIWAHETARRDVLEGGDLEEAITAAGAIGDDRLQRMGRGTVRPETFTHGSSAQRVEWFKRGYDSGDVNRCDTSKLASATPRFTP